MKFGYARVSTNAQDLELQRVELEVARCEMVFAEKVSGARKRRPELEKLLGQLRTGDTIVVRAIYRS